VFLSPSKGSCFHKLSGVGKFDDGPATKQIVALLSAPLDKYKNVMTALKLSNYPQVMECLDIETNKVMANIVIQNIMKNSTYISNGDKVYIFVTFALLYPSASIYPSNLMGLISFRWKPCLD